MFSWHHLRACLDASPASLAGQGNLASGGEPNQLTRWSKEKLEILGNEAS
jgi:hypothetical protein